MSTEQLHIGSGLSMPVDLVTQRIFVCGNPGSGKTNTGVVVVEELLAHGQQVVIIDPMDVWWGLKASGDGQNAGHPVVVFGGHHQDLPLGAGDGGVIADMVVDHRLPAVLSLSRFETDKEMLRFVTDFARRLFFRKDEPRHRRPLMLVIDEAALFIPPTPESDEGAKLIPALRRICKQGRVLGFGMMTIDQRPASVNTNIRNLAELLIAHRTTGAHDLDALDKWVKAKATPEERETLMTSLATLKQGEAWFWSPEWLGMLDRVHVRRRHTFDSSFTPKVGGQAVVSPKKLAAVDLEALRPKLAQAIEEARGNDPEELKRRIRELETKLASPSSPPPPPPPPQLVPVLTPDQLKAVENLQASVVALSQKVTAWRDEVKQAVEGVRPPVVHTTPHPPHHPPPSPSPSSPPSSPPTSPNGALTPQRQKIVDAIARLEVLGASTVSRRHVAALAGVSRNSSAYRENLSGLRADGLIDYGAGGVLLLTPAGKRLAARHPVPASAEDLINGYRRHVLDEYQVSLLDVLLATRSPLGRETLASAAGKSSSSSAFREALSGMRQLGVIDYRPGGGVCVNESLWAGQQAG